jgi:hypothetical protein
MRLYIITTLLLLLAIASFNNAQETTVQVELDVDSSTHVLSSNNTREAKIDAFIKWMIDNGAIFSKKIKLASIPGMGFGIVVDEENGISPKETYLKIPYDKLVIGKDYISNLRYINYAFTDLDKQFGEDIKHKIILYILHEKCVRGDKSFWKPYFDVLPKTFSVPAFFSKDELEILKGTAMYEGAIQDVQGMERAYNGIAPRVFDRYPNIWPRDKVTLDEFKWATWIFNSRLFFIEGKNPREHLVPLADMINCEETDEGDQVFVEMDTSNKFAVLQADRFFKKGQQITETYGKKSNADLLRFEGFIFDEAKDLVNDCVTLRAGEPLSQHYMDQLRNIFGFMSVPQYCFSASLLEKGMWPAKDGSSFQYILYRIAAQEGKSISSRSDLERMSQSLNNQDYKKIWQNLLEIIEGQLKQNMANEKVRSYILGGRNDALLTYNAKLAIRYALFERAQLQKLVNILKQRV